MAGLLDFLGDSEYGSNPRAMSGRQNVGMGLLGLGTGLSQMSAGRPVNIMPTMQGAQEQAYKSNQSDAYRRWVDNMEKTNPTGLAKLKSEGLLDVMRANPEMIEAYATGRMGQMLAAPKELPTVVQEAQYLYPNDPEAQRTYIERVKTKPLVNMATPLPDAMRELEVGRIAALDEQINAGASMIPAMKQGMDALLSGARTGPVDEVLMPLRRIVADITGRPAEELTADEIFRSASAYLVPRMRVPGSGATSDFEARMFERATINPTNTEASNILIAGTAIQTQVMNERLQYAMYDYMQANGNLRGFREYVDANKIDEIYPTVTSDEELNQLRPGTVWKNEAGGLFILKKDGTTQRLTR